MRKAARAGASSPCRRVRLEGSEVMSRSDSFSEPEATPVAPVERLWHTVATTRARVVLGLAAGLLSARLMRRVRLQWSWAAAALFATPLADAVMRASGTVLGVGALSAAAWGRRWHREDIDAGRDLRELAAAERSPLDVLRSLLHLGALRWRVRTRSGWFAGDELIIGRDEANRLIAIPMGGAAGGTHALVLGATGSGKTITEAWIAARAIERGMGAVVIDPKGDRALREAMAGAARASAKAFIEWSPEGPCVYNPYARGSDTEIAESDLGQWLDPATASARPFDLLEAVRARAVVYFDLDCDSRPLLTQMLGAAIVQDLQTTVAALQGRPTSTLALIDEFSALSVEQVVRLFGRARSAGLSLVLGTQELADLRMPARERALEQVIGNLSVLVAHRQVLPESCALIAGLAGTRGAWRTSRHSGGRTTRARTTEPNLGAARLMGLAPGVAAGTL